LNNQNPILIIGQGISGTMLSWYLYEANIPFIVLDEAKENSASKVAAGIINPVTGRRIVTTWMIDQIMPFAVDAYQEFGKQFNIQTITKKNIIDFFPTKQMQEAFKERVNENAPYLKLNDTIDFSEQLNYHLGYGIIEPCYIVQVQNIIATWRKFLLKENLLVAEKFNEESIQIKADSILYEDITAAKIIFADGKNCSNNRWFKNLPWAANKGEALIIECASLNEGFIYKKGITIAPIGNNQFWVGANYIWDYTDDLPTKKFYDETKIQLQQILKAPFTIIAHKAAIRPANVERRPFVGFHPIEKNIGILNGMGAKGTSLAPYFANELVQQISNQSAITPEADVYRFAKILSRK
jgi:glycine/D-amino acid oxidase-like deaminating enzyme